MTQVNLTGLIQNTLTRVGIYTALEEAVVNSMHSIEESGREDGYIKIVLQRITQDSLGFQDDALPPIFSIEVIDNGSGFTKQNRDSFDTVFSQLKALKGGKGFGRFTYLKCFNDVAIKSIYSEGKAFRERSFNFKKEDDIITDEKDKKITADDLLTVVSLNGLKEQHQDKINKRVDTVARKLLERILFYFSLEDYKCPIITVIDSHTGNAVTLNDLVGGKKDVSIISSGEVNIESIKGEKFPFKYKVFKVFYADNMSKINLIANNRLVTSELLSEYIPDIKGDFLETTSDRTRNFSIQVYVSGKYLDENVTFDRNSFLFENDKNIINSLSKSEIEKSVALEVKGIFPEEFKTRYENKKQRIAEYVEEKAYWHKAYLKDLDLEGISHDIPEDKIEEELQKIKIKRESEFRKKAHDFLSDETKNQTDKIREIVDNLTEVSKSDLVHYVATRRVVLDMFIKSLEWNQDEKYELEQAVHDIIFPTKKDSDEVNHFEHNLWILDERLNFHKYLMSDKAIEPQGDRPDIALFGNKIVVRGENELHNPILVFEFKRPERNEYKEEENPLIQIARYTQQIRDGKCLDAKGRGIIANQNTPAYGYLVCDLTTKIRDFCDQLQLIETPDREGYVGYHKTYNLYFEVVSYNKLTKDAEMRNKIFFEKLKLDSR